MPCRTRVVVAAAIVVIWRGAPLLAQDGHALFEENCSICHTIGGSGTDAPDLKNVTERRSRAWVIGFTLDPEGVTKSGDPYAAALAKRFDGTIMPTPEGLSRKAVEGIVEYIEKRSVEGPLAPAKAESPTAIFTPDEVARGGALYGGGAPLTNRGPSCIGCHEDGAAVGLGGGTLGPSLALASRRLQGARGLSVWLSAPSTPVMRTVYRRSPLATDEIHSLAAFLDHRANAYAPAPAIVRAAPLSFLGLGLATTIVGFVLIGIAWRDRFRAVRRPLVRSAGERAATHVSPERRQGFRSGGLR
jgi:mono/diheme cytochrome c family protein